MFQREPGFKTSSRFFKINTHKFNATTLSHESILSLSNILKNTNTTKMYHRYQAITIV